MANEDLMKGLEDLLHKAEGSLIPTIEHHMTSNDFRAKKDSLDFLGVKNSMMLSYMIEMTKALSKRFGGTDEQDDEDDTNVERLTEMRVALEKMWPMEKKMRYQLDKLLALEAQSFATAGEQERTHPQNGQQDDPLSYRPNLNAMKDDDSGLSSSDDDSDGAGGGESDVGDEGDDDDDDLAAAKATLHMANEKKKKKQKQTMHGGTKDAGSSSGMDGSGVYRAPRMAAMPFADNETAELEKERRRKRRLRNTELVRALRDQYGDAPEQEDYHGGSAYGQQREAARRMAERQQEKKQYEEDFMVRLQTTKKEKKEKRRLMREEGSNLAAMTDLGNLVRGVNDAFDEDKDRRKRRSKHRDGGGMDGLDDSIGGDVDRRPTKKRDKITAKNSFQEALYGMGSKKKKKSGSSR